MKSKTIVILCLLVLPFIVNAQYWNRHKYEFSYGIGASNFMGDISAPINTNQLVWVKLFNSVGPVANVSLKYNLQNRHFVTGAVFFGQMYAEDPIGDINYWDAGRKMNTFFTEISGRYEFQFFKEKNKKTVYRVLGESPFKNLSVPSYVFIGLGGMINLGGFTQINKVTSAIVNETYVAFTPVIPIGIGAKIRINKLTYLGIEAGTRIAFSDKIDNVSNGWFDQYQFVTFNLSHKLRSNQNGWPRFRK
ncbi:MAG: hypothetical protein JEZ09_03820 [Salinivirgaceae bacterium]|nr:hypothetical protein [Salinivirgaceae bacterium]